MSVVLFSFVLIGDHQSKEHVCASAKLGHTIRLGLFSTTMSWFLNPEGVAKKEDDVDSLVPDPADPTVMVSNKR